MLTAVEFDDQRPVDADEIGDERADRHLPAEFMAEQASITELQPQAPFDVGLIRT